ncbi:MAG: YggT family protein [Bacillota bacterium]|nr:YggT family protein [Bacillota bacterium]
MIALFANIIINILALIQLIIILDAILSFVPIDAVYKVREFTGMVTEPILKPFRVLQERIAPGLMIDFSPIGAIFVIGIIRRIVIGVLYF